MNSTLKTQLASLKHQIINTDAFGDAYDDLNEKYMNFIDSIENSQNKIENLKTLKEMFIGDDLYASHPEEIEEYNIFPMIDDIIKNL